MYLENTETGKGTSTDYEEFCQDIVDIALNAKSEQDFKNYLKNFYNKFLDWIVDSYDDYDDDEYEEY